MDNKKQYYTEEYKKLLNLYESNIDTLDEMSKNLITNQLAIYDNAFKGDKKAIDFIKKNSSELKDLFDELNNSFETIHTKITNNSGYTNSIITSHSGATKEDLNKAVDAKERLDKIEEERNILLQAISDIDSKLSTASKSEKRRLTNEKATLNNQVSKLNREKGLLKPLKGVFTDSELDGEIQNRKDLNDLTNEQIKLLNKVSLKQEEINELTQEHTKNVGAFTAMAKQAGEAIIAVAKAGFEKWKEIDEKVFSVGRQIGLSSNQLKGYQQNVLNNYDELASKLGMSFEELFKFQESYTKNTGRAIVLTNEQVMSLGTMSKLVGDVATNDMVKNMDDFGASTQTATSYLALNMARARSQGLDAQKASEAFSKNVKLAASHNFREGVNGISKMTLLSQKLKFNMDSIANAADKFETIEGAIGTSANLQVLGGSFAAQFGNPLEAMNMAMLDMEGFTNKIVDTFSNKAIFNRETGQVEMSAIDKRFLKEAAKNLGISYEEAWNMASQQAKIGDVERQINKTQNFSEEDKAWITSNSQYNAETKQHQVTFFENGEQKTVDVKDLTAEQLKEVKAQAISEKAIQGDVHGIHSILKAYAQKEMGDSKSWNEMQKGWQESMEINVADAEDTVLNWIKVNPLKFMTDENWWLAKLGLDVGKIALGGLIYKYIGNLFEEGFGNIGGKISPSMTKAKNWAKGLGGKLWQGTKSVGRGIIGGAAKAGKYLKNAPGWLKVVGLAATAIGGGMALTSAADGSQVDKSKLGGREVEPNDINSNELESTSVNKTEELTELEKQTLLLKTIAEKQGVDVSKIINNSTINSDNVKDNSVLSIDNVDSTISSVGDTTFMAAQTKVGKKGLAAIGKKITGESVAKSVVKGVPKGGALGLGSLAVDFVNMGGQSLDLWEEGSHTDKLMNVGSKGLEYAGYGALIGSVIPVLGTTVGAAVGGVIGTAVGTFQQYGKEIKEFGSKVYNGVKDGLFGSDNMTESDKIQQQYEETKIGIVDIRDPQLEQKAQLATCQIHDIVVSMWHHMNGKQSNGLEKDKGLLGGVGDTISNVGSYVGSNIVNQITSPFKFIGGIAKGLFGSEEKETSIKNQYNKSSLNNQSNNAYQNFDYKVLNNGYVANNVEIKGNPIRKYNNKEYDLRDPKQRRDYEIDKILNKKVSGSRERQLRDNKLNLENRAAKILYGIEPYNYKKDERYKNDVISKSSIDNISIKNNNKNDVISKPTVGDYQYIRPTVDIQQSSYNNSMMNNKLDLNVSGTIKLTSDRGNSVDIDLNKLLNNPSFINQLTTMISNEMNKRSNFGVGKDYNSVSHIMGGASSRSVLNATTNGAK